MSEENLPTISVWGFDELLPEGTKEAPPPARVALAARFFSGTVPDSTALWPSSEVSKLVARWLRACHPNEFSGDWLPQGVVLAAARQAGCHLVAHGGQLEGEIGIAESFIRQRIAEVNAASTRPSHFNLADGKGSSSQVRRRSFRGLTP